ncbi:MAG: HAD family hydrolase [SAR202 cluster bacterium]|nr:HAD family hydrolase [SAR202 cluster bacterium]MDP6713322.1 HAD family hydrolase [SAR202 cluster bacterium]
MTSHFSPTILGFPGYQNYACTSLNNVSNNPLKSIKAITFDLDGTLWDFEMVMRSSVALALEELAERDPIAASRLDVDRIISVRDRIADELKTSVISLEQVRLEGFKQALKDVDRPNDELATHINNVYLQYRYANIVPFADVVPALTALRRRYKIGALTNGNSYPERVGMGHLFDFAALASEQGISKPDPRIFHIAVEMAQCEPAELLHVGDDLVDDIEGASAAGVQSVWINRLGRHIPLEGAPELQISNLSTLIDWLIE